MSKPRTIEIKPSRHFPFVSRHPWAHVASLAPSHGELPTGEVVDLVTHDGSWVARGLYSPSGKLCVRLYTWDPAEAIDDAFFARRIDEAIQRRQTAGLEPVCDAVRIVYSEADGISGLIVDRYRDFLIVQVNAAVIAQRIDAIVAHLRERMNPKAIIVRIDAATAKAEGIEARDDVVFGDPPPADLLIRENDIEYTVDLMHSQKTGMYLDQRENRRLAASYMKGREVLDICSYVGGFAMNAAKLGEATSVLGIDTSERAVAAATANAQRNGLENVRFEKGDCFQRLDQFKQEGKRFSGIILDPPRFAGSRQSVDAAVRAYTRLNRGALEILEPGGILVTCSCSGRVTRPDFMKMLQKVGRQTRRDLILFENRGAAADHPVRLSCPETDYLKCVICEAR
ncbi:Ribosomal RNA large subunit methyltransferase I [Rosistilla carotiformis]|uniref:Ribosomal RNA large subunit methyltransferase I n=1 Tax=Rosistilla carotiformis TaxID=2528017 RepID=A0A518JSK8_9BACT|nr:class I SAM-dependent rRNA methyltransferase [Rosistilla carotiformis]QDV68515.1 Ribosomal RNA large subunit methyltransferase I [Rosistilla carotiformis]